MSSWQTDSRTQELQGWTVLEQHSFQPTLVLREFDIVVEGESLTGIQRQRHVELSCLGSLRWSLSAFQLPPHLDQHPSKEHRGILWVFWATRI